MLWLSNSTSLEVTCTRPGQVFRGLCSIRGRMSQLHLHTFSIRDKRRSSVFTSNFKSQVLLRSDSCPTPCQLTDALAIDFDKFDTQPSHSAQVGVRLLNGWALYPEACCQKSDRHTRRGVQTMGDYQGLA